MTIKQQGGIFGRNPTFNDLTVEGTLTSSGTFAPSGQVTFSEDGDAALVVNRNTNSGTIVQVKQANAEVGYIATYGGDLIVGTGDTSMRFIDSLDCYFPVSNATGTTRDNAIDIGYTEARYKDLYLGGGIYLQASSATPVAANYLDDYEEGTYTPSLYGNTTGSGTTLPLSSAYNTLAYTKIGRQVTIGGKLETNGSHSASGYLILTVPFVVADLSDTAGGFAGSVFFYRTGQLHTNPSVITSEGNSYVIFYENTAGGDVTTINAENMDAAIEVFFGFTYFTT